MRNAFVGYYKPTEIELTRMWENSVFVLDANVLLNLYRYSAETNTEILNTFQQMGDRIWIPYQAALEYHQRRMQVIEHQEDSYLDLQKFLKEIQGELKNRLLSDDHSFLADQLIDKVVKIFKDLEVKLHERKEEYLSLFENDKLQDAISNLLERKVGNNFSKERLEEICKEGKVRYEDETHPGFHDEKAKKDIDKYRDLIIWFQTIEHAKATYKPVIMLTDEKTDDWWLKFKGELIGPRPELIHEMRDKANVSFYMYRVDPFMENAQKFLDVSIKPEAIDEVHKFRIRDDKRMESKDDFTKALRFQRDAVAKLSEELQELANQTEIFNVLDISKALKQYTNRQKSRLEEVAEDNTADDSDKNK